MKSTTEKSSFQHCESRKGISLLLEGSTIKDSGLFGEVSYRIPILTFLNGDALGKEIPLLQQQVTMGRGEDADIHIMEPSVSRQHVQLTCRKLINKGDATRGLRVVLQDLGSKNGTFVNYRRVKRAVLRPGDKIALGRIIVKFEFRDVADQEYYEEIYRLATTDHLTSLLNKMTITRVLNEELIHLRRYRRRLSIVLADLDNFKSLNDTMGHLFGDRVLQAAAQNLRRNLRTQDRAGRFGGEEFLLVLPETGQRGAVAFAERARKDLVQELRQTFSLDQEVTASFGVASYPRDGREADRLLEHADAALYRAKAKGKNRVEVWRPERQPDISM